MELKSVNNYSYSPQYSPNFTQAHEYTKTRKYSSAKNSLELFKEIQFYQKQLLENCELIDKYHNILAAKIQKIRINKKKVRMYLNHQAQLIQLKSNILKSITSFENNHETKLYMIKSMLFLIHYKLSNIQLFNHKYKITWY